MHVLEPGKLAENKSQQLSQKLQKFVPHVKYDLTAEHDPIGDRSGTHRIRWFQTCLNDYHDLMIAARVGRNGSVRQIAGYASDPDDTRPRYVSWAIFKIYWALHSTDTPRRKRTLQEQGCPCIGSVFITSDMLAEAKVYVVKSLHTCVGSVFVFR